MTDRLRPVDPGFSARKESPVRDTTRAMMGVFSGMESVVGDIKELPHPANMGKLASAVVNATENGVPTDQSETDGLAYARALFTKFGETVLGLKLTLPQENEIFSGGR